MPPDKGIAGTVGCGPNSAPRSEVYSPVEFGPSPLLLKRSNLTAALRGMNAVSEENFPYPRPALELLAAEPVGELLHDPLLSSKIS